MTAAWREAGEVWKAVSSRTVCARLKLAGQGVGRYLDRRSERPVYITVVSVYAPTFRASVEQKEQFFSDIQAKLDDVNKHDVLLLVGDFNARVGSSVRCEEDPAWDGVRGLYGMGKMNEAGEALLSCALNEMAIMNAYFQKKMSHKNTWQHPGSKKWHCIDYVIMRKNQRRLCNDVFVMRSAECWTDHKLLKAKLMLRGPPKPKKPVKRKRFAVSRLSDEKTREQYRKCVEEAGSGEWCSEAGGNRKQELFRDGLRSSAEKCLGWENRR